MSTILRNIGPIQGDLTRNEILTRVRVEAGGAISKELQPVFYIMRHLLRMLSATRYKAGNIGPSHRLAPVAIAQI